MWWLLLAVPLTFYFYEKQQTTTAVAAFASGGIPAGSIAAYPNGTSVTQPIAILPAILAATGATAFSTPDGKSYKLSSTGVVS